MSEEFDIYNPNSYYSEETATRASDFGYKYEGTPTSDTWGDAGFMDFMKLDPFEATGAAMGLANATGVDQDFIKGVVSDAFEGSTVEDKNTRFASRVPKDDDILSNAKKMFERGFDMFTDPTKMKSPLMMMGLMGISNAQKSANDRELADKRAQTEMSVVNQRYANERKTAEENSAAIVGLPKKKDGIIQQALKRIDGTAVFNTNGTIRS